jgi:hypothetical protein
VGVYKSDDGGDSWRRLPNAVQPERVKMKSFVCRVMRLVADPARPEELYAALEVGGVMRSLDGGETWDDCSSDLLKLAELPQLKSKIDSAIESACWMARGVRVRARPGPCFPRSAGPFESANRGSTWRSMDIGRFSPLTYARDILVSPSDPPHL